MHTNTYTLEQEGHGGPGSLTWVSYLVEGHPRNRRVKLFQNLSTGLAEEIV